jgi:hypothetical protein
MAILTLDSLTGCNSIPSFFGGNSDTPGNPTYTVFYQTAAPTSWVKDTTASLNDKALRIIGGANGTTLSPGGSLAFTSVFTTKTYPGVTLGPAAAGTISANSTPVIFSIASTNANPDTVTMSVHNGAPATLPPHDHPYQTAPGAQNLISAPGGTASLANATAPALTTTTQYGPGGTNHTHTFRVPHSHTATSPATTHGHSTTSTHTHASTTASANFSINYIDVIIAYKA